MNHTYFIEETHDYLALSALFHAGGVEVRVTDRPPIGTVKMWRMVDADTGELIGGITLEIRDNVYAVGGLAVDPARQGENLGGVLLDHLYAEARKTSKWAGRSWTGTIRRRLPSSAASACGSAPCVTRNCCDTNCEKKKELK